ADHCGDVWLRQRRKSGVGARGINGDCQVLLGVDQCSVEIEDKQANVCWIEWHQVKLRLSWPTSHRFPRYATTQRSWEDLNASSLNHTTRLLRQCWSATIRPALTTCRA